MLWSGIRLHHIISDLGGWCILSTHLWIEKYVFTSKVQYFWLPLLKTQSNLARHSVFAFAVLASFYSKSFLLGTLYENRSPLYAENTLKSATSTYWVTGPFWRILTGRHPGFILLACGVLFRWYKSNQRSLFSHQLFCDCIFLIGSNHYTFLSLTIANFFSSQPAFAYGIVWWVMTPTWPFVVVW